MIHIREYAHGTYLVSEYPWGVFRAGRALCSDGRVRALKHIAPTADTSFSVPAAVTVRGKTVSGYVTSETMRGMTVESEDDPIVIKFVAVKYGRNHAMLPDGAYREEES